MKLYEHIRTSAQCLNPVFLHTLEKQPVTVILPPQKQFRDFLSSELFLQAAELFFHFLLRGFKHFPAEVYRQKYGLHALLPLSGEKSMGFLQVFCAIIHIREQMAVRIR
jgi:hypothetical protein